MHVEPIRLVELRQLSQGSVDRIDAVDTMDWLNVDFDRRPQRGWGIGIFCQDRLGAEDE